MSDAPSRLGSAVNRPVDSPSELRTVVNHPVETSPVDIRATYRLQLTPGFSFDDAASVLPYLAELGISHVYLSPVFRAAPGSTHGYDIVDHEAISEEHGGAEAFRALLDRAASLGMGVVLDIVPHHAAAVTPGNRWWWDVLRFGRISLTAPYFDIDWWHPEERLREKVVLPVLGDHYGRVLETGAITIDEDPDDLVRLHAAGAVLPLSAGATGSILEAVAERTGNNEIGLLARALVAAEQADDPRRRFEDTVAAVQRAREVRDADGSVATALAKVIAEINGDLTTLDRICEQQHFRLSRWQVAATELGYRRFFDINSLVALRTENEDVFTVTHNLVLGLVRDGLVHGLRVDHVDGLRDPENYLRRLRAGAPDAWIGVEKILSIGETLPTTWPIDGTTGYEHLNRITWVLTDPRGEQPLDDLYRSFTGDEQPFETVAVAKRRLVLREVLASDLERMTKLLVRACERRRRYRDYTRTELRDALAEVAAHAPAYRSYGQAWPDRPPRVTDQDTRFVHDAVDAARADNAAMDPEVFDLLADILTFTLDGEIERELAIRFQQLSGPVMAKGIEDTALYTSVRLLSHNEVGGHPSTFAIGPDRFHRTMAAVAATWPRTMLTTSTHDTKRSEDVRARILAIAEDPDGWRSIVERWSDRVDGLVPGGFPDKRTEWFVYQTLLGAHPIGPDRLWPAIQKSLREGKELTSWTRPDETFEKAVERSIVALCSDEAFQSELASAIAPYVDAGRWTSLATVALRTLAPGFPDTYQGQELWDFSLVDPDNRRPVDFERRALLLRELVPSATSVETSPRGGLARRFVARPEDGTAKLGLLHGALALRSRHPAAFSTGASYRGLPVAGDGDGPAGALAFARGTDDGTADVCVVVPRFPRCGRERWTTTTVALPDGWWRDIATGEGWAGDAEHRVDALVAGFPVAVLERIER